MIEEMFEGPETIWNDSLKRCYIHSENKFVLAEETKVTKNFKCVLAVLNVRRKSFDDRCHTFSTQLLTLNYLLYSPTDAAPQFL